MGSGRCLFFAIHMENGLIDRIFLSNTLIYNDVSRETLLKPKKKTQDNVSRETF